MLARSSDQPDQPTARDLAFGVAPRINAAGRIAEAELAISLLLEEDPTGAERIADELEEVNRSRRELTTAAVEQALGLAASLDGPGPIALRHDAWLPGIVGLIAGRLAEVLGRPVAIAAPIGDEWRGSVRAPEDFNAAAALEACAELLVKRGGHAGAGGFSVAADRWEAFALAFAHLPRPYPPSGEQPLPAGRVTVDLVLPASHLSWSLADQIARLAPFGPGHVEPILAVTGLRVGDARRVGTDERHLTLRMLRGAETFDAIAFGTPADRPLPEEGSRLDLVGTLDRDNFQGEPRLRLRVLDFATADASPLSARRLAAQARERLAVEVAAPVATR